MADKTYKMRALQHLPPKGARKAMKRGAEFDATEQERRDLLRNHRAEEVKPAPAKPSEGDTKK